ncbi:MAG: glycerol-3-phosphate 1-O-acyltransferase PlsY [Clostridia bacterium]|nr:glycerol-3-phosphate 1-O-acyltransferase PlsY [Clostridia bacterium]
MNYDIFYTFGVLQYYFPVQFVQENSGTVLKVVILVACAILGYLIGSINTGVLLSKIYGKDVRSEGSGNAGATNMTRVFGKKAGIFTFLGDFLKSVIATYIGMALWGFIGAYIAGIACILGHAYPLYFGFKGGKGVACIAAMGLVTTWDILLICLLVWILVLLFSKMVSLASVMAMVVYPFALYTLHIFLYNEGYGPHPGKKVIFAMILAAIVIFLHRKNLVRIFNHEESKIGQKKGKK